MRSHPTPLLSCGPSPAFVPHRTRSRQHSPTLTPPHATPRRTSDVRAPGAQRAGDRRQLGRARSRAGGAGAACSLQSVTGRPLAAASQLRPPALRRLRRASDAALCRSDDDRRWSSSTGLWRRSRPGRACPPPFPRRATCTSGCSFFSHPAVVPLLCNTSPPASRVLNR